MPHRVCKKARRAWLDGKAKMGKCLSEYFLFYYRGLVGLCLMTVCGFWDHLTKMRADAGKAKLYHPSNHTAPMTKTKYGCVQEVCIDKKRALEWFHVGREYYSAKGSTVLIYVSICLFGPDNTNIFRNPAEV